MMQTQNRVLKSMLLELLEELRKSSMEKVANPCAEEERSSDAMKRELKKLQKENKKIKDNLCKKQANLAKCLDVLENNNCEIDKLSKHIEVLCSERDKFRDQLKRLQCVINKKDKTISSLKQKDVNNRAMMLGREEPAQNVNCLKQQLENEMHKNEKSQNNQSIKHQNLDAQDFDGLVRRLQSAEKDLEASNLELLEYEEENRCYCQKIDSLLKTIKCLKESKLRSDEDKKEYFERLNDMRNEFQEMYEQKNKTIEELNKKLQMRNYSEGDNKTEIAKKDLQIKYLNEKLFCLDNEHKRCQIMETKYKDCQLKFECFFKQIKSLQKFLSEIYCKLDFCDKTIRDLKDKNKLLEKKISSLESILDTKSNGAIHVDVIIEELQCINTKLQKQLSNKESIITSLEECLDKSNEILVNCEKEMNLIEQRNSKFQREMRYIKSKLEGELIQNQCLAIKCNILNKNQNNCFGNIYEDIEKFKSEYKNLLAEAVAKKQDLKHIKTELVDCFDRAQDLSRNRECSRVVRPQLTSGKSYFPSCTCSHIDSGQVKTIRKGKHRSRSTSPHKKPNQRCRSCPEKKVDYINLQRAPSTPNIQKSRRKNTKCSTKSQTKCSYQSSFESPDLERLPKSVKSLIEYKNKKNQIRTIRSDSNLETITIRIFNGTTERCTSNCNCKCMTVITKRYEKDRINKNYCEHC
ncbi:coiled-coil domain-containing protein 186-like isoform X2 [Diorhabda carinulata]|nr:coiled-coil domain-containing protein 186-like isoform X2 [Diorhabda carinulata]